MDVVKPVYISVKNIHLKPSISKNMYKYYVLYRPFNDVSVTSLG